MRKLLCVVLAAGVITSAPAAEERINQDVYWKIRQEATANSKILQTVHVLTDLYGSRLTGSPSLKAVWRMGHPADAGVGAPERQARTVGFRGSLRAGRLDERPALRAHRLTRERRARRGGAGLDAGNQRTGARARDTRDASAAYRPENRSPPSSRNSERASAARSCSSANRCAYQCHSTAGTASEEGACVEPGEQRCPGATAPGQQAPVTEPAESNQSNQNQQNQPQPATPRQLTNNEIQRQFNEFLVSAGAVLRVNDARREHGQIRAFGAGSAQQRGTVLLPTVVMRNEDYGRIWRLLADGRPVELEFDIANTTYPEGATAYNVSVEIPGTDKADEVVMLGGHLDSWHGATGATDNAIGCAVTMEAVRILSAIGVKPRRTIRLALWSGEEQGLFGSQAYVREHFGTFEEPKPAYSRFAGYVNIDSGTGLVRDDVRVRSRRGRHGPHRSARTVARSWRARRDDDDQSRKRQQRSLVIQCGRPAGNQRQSGSD